MCVAASSAQAIFTVTTLTDPTSGIAANCTNQTSGVSLDASCSLRDALAAAAAFNGSSGTVPVTVNFASSLAAVGNPGTIQLGATALSLPSYTTVQGLTAGSGPMLTNLISIHGGGHTAFTVAGTVTNSGLNNLTVTHGAPAVDAAGVIAVSQCTFSSNSTISGGAIRNSGTLVVQNSTFNGNSASSYGGAIYSTGPNSTGPVVTARNLTVSGSTFQGNISSTDGGAIYIGIASVGSIDNSTFTGNSASRSGAAVYINNGSGLSRVTNSILSGDTGGNECDGVGCSNTGQAFVFAGSEPNGANESGTITMIVTLSNGQVITVNGGYGQYSTADSLASYFGGYISNNYYSALSAQGFGSTLVIAPQSGSITSVQFQNPSSYFTVTPVPNSVISGTGNTVAVGTTAANLSLLANYGGPTQTILPLPGSVALCTITPTNATGKDQRGLPRATTYGTDLCQDSGSVQTNYGLNFSQQPVSAVANVAIAPAPSVRIQESGQNLAQANSLVTATVQTGALGGQTSARTDSTGVAAFSNLYVTSVQTADKLTASLTVGPYKVSTTSNPFDVSQQPTASLTGNATFPLTAVQSTASQTFVFTNTSSISLNITSLAVYTAPEFMQTNTCGLTLAAGDSCNITITFRPLTIGTRLGTFTLASTASGYTQTITLVGTSAPTVARLVGTGAFPSTDVNVTSTPQNIMLTNVSGSVVGISSIATTGDFSQTNQCDTSLAVGAQCAIAVTFKPTAGGVRTGTLSVSTTSLTGAVPSLLLSGKGISYTGTLVGRGDFPSTSVGSPSAVQSFTFTNTGTGTLSISGIATTGDFSQTNQCGASLAPGETCNISVTFNPTAMGSRAGTLTVTTNATTTIPPVSLSGTGTLVQASLTSGTDFGLVALTTSSQPQTFVLTNTGNDTLVISGITTTGDFSKTTTCGTSLAGGAACDIVVVFTPTLVGSRTGTLVVTSNAKVAIPAAILSGTGIPAPSFTLGDNTSGSTSTTLLVTAGSTATGTLKFTSTNGFAGSIALTCTTQGAPPTEAACTVTSPVTLTAGGTATATVTITTTSRTQTAGVAALPHHGRLAYMVLLGMLSVALFAVRRAGSAVRAASLLTLLLFVSLGLTGCAGGGSGTTSNPNGTAAGTYTYIVSATSGSVTATQSITVTVQ
ncbi:beta strand repeat-containing protein [Terriglobus sp. RCC_193]|uniref:beta strand repeat-containing protein n=1 Tax=Terriglobus sp. RCC_193 TaxID=3239218 RepID=UPI0035260A45